VNASLLPPSASKGVFPLRPMAPAPPRFGSIGSRSRESAVLFSSSWTAASSKPNGRNCPSRFHRSCCSLQGLRVHRSSGSRFPVSQPAEAAREALPEVGGRAVAEVTEGAGWRRVEPTVVVQITPTGLMASGTAKQQIPATCRTAGSRSGVHRREDPGRNAGLGSLEG